MTKYDSRIDKLEGELARYKRCVEKLRVECGDQELLDAFSDDVDALRVALAALYQVQAQVAK